jgi:hypothetical protein
MPFLPDLARAIPGLCMSRRLSFRHHAHYLGHSAGSMEGEWLFKSSLVVLTTKLVSVSPTSAIEKSHV